MTFYEYAVEKYGKRVAKDRKICRDAYDDQSAKVDFVGDMIREESLFPSVNDYDTIYGYLLRRNACREAKMAFKRLWREYLCEKA